MRYLTLLLLFLFSVFVTAPTQVVDTIAVYVVKTEGHYHKESCHFLNQGKVKTTLKEAKVEGYTPCRVCFKGAATSTKTKTYSKGRCNATAQKGTRCKRTASSGSGYCWQHQ